MTYKNCLLHDKNYIELVFTREKAYCYVRGVRKNDSRRASSAARIPEQLNDLYKLYSNIFCL